MTSLIFGDIFRCDNKDYIFLAKTTSVIYAAEILDPNLTKQVDTLFKNRLAAGKLNKVEDSILYCYVILETKEYKGRMAHLGNTGKDDFSLVIEKLPISLNLDDLKEIKKEICERKAISIALRELVKDIGLEN